MEIIDGVGIIHGEIGKRQVTVVLAGAEYQVYDTKRAQSKFNPFATEKTYEVYPYYIKASVYDALCYVAKGAKVGHQSERCHYATWHQAKAGIVEQIRMIDVIARGGHLCKNCFF